MRALYEVQRAALEAGDLSTLVSLYTEDAALLPPDAPAVRGRSAIQVRLRGELDRYAMRATVEVLDVGLAGDRALAAGRYSISTTPRDGGASFRDEGTWLDVLRRDPDGSWSIALATWSSGARAAADRTPGAEPPRLGGPRPVPHDELAAFDFLIGDWSCDVRVLDASGAYDRHRATWSARYAFEGRAILDEYRETGPAGELVRLGVTIRSLDRERETWVMKWFDALRSTWLDLGPEDLGGVRVEHGTITFAHRLPGEELMRVTFAGIGPDRFAWRADHSADGGRTWRDAVMVIEARRVE